MNNDEKILKILETMQGDISVIKDDVTTLKGDVSTLKGDVTTLKGDVSTLKEQMAETNVRLTNVENRLTVIEHDHGKKMDALFDGYSQLYEISTETRKDVRDLKAGYITHDMEIVSIKSKQAR